MGYEGAAFLSSYGFRGFVFAESSCLCLHCCGPARSCSLRAFDRQAHQVFLFDRPPRMDACCLGCCLMEMQAFDGDGQLAGAVYQRLVRRGQFWGSLSYVVCL